VGKYRLHPIYIPRPFQDSQDKDLPLYRGAYQVPSTIYGLRDLMTDLLLHDLENLPNERLVLILSNEKREMFGEKRVPAEEKDADYLLTGSSASPVTKPKKERRGRRCYRVKS
jgi:hypothetical protein